MYIVLSFWDALLSFSLWANSLKAQLRHHLANKCFLLFLACLLLSQAIGPSILGVPTASPLYLSTLRTYHVFLWSHLSHSLCSSYLRGRNSLTPVPTMCPGFSFVSPMATQHDTEPTKRSITQQLRHWLSHSINDWILGRKYLRNAPEDLEMFSGK